MKKLISVLTAIVICSIASAQFAGVQRGQQEQSSILFSTNRRALLTNGLPGAEHSMTLLQDYSDEYTF
jgi:hypothetical protein